MLHPVAERGRAGGYTQQGEHRGPPSIVLLQIERDGYSGASHRQRNPPLGVIQAAQPDDGAQLLVGERCEEERRGARADGWQQIVGVLGCHDQDKVLWRLLERLQQRVGGLIAGAVHMVDEKHAARASRGLELRTLFQHSHLRNRKLA